MNGANRSSDTSEEDSASGSRPKNQAENQPEKRSEKQSGKQPVNRITPLHLGLAVLVMIIWGINFPVAKLGLLEMPPMLLLSFRFLLVGLVLVPFVSIPKKQMGRVLLLSFVLGTVHFGLMFTGIKGVDGSVASIAIQLQVPFAAILAAIIFKDYLGWRRMAGMIFAFAGIVLIAGEPRMGSSLWSLGLVLFASFIWAVSNILVKLIKDVSPLSLLAWSSLLSAPQLLFWSVILEDGHLSSVLTAGWYGWGAIAFMAILVSLFGYGVWYNLVARYDVNQTMPLTLLVPIFGVLSSSWMLGEELPWQTLAGGGLTLLGVGIIIVRRPRTADGPMKS